MKKRLLAYLVALAVIAAVGMVAAAKALRMRACPLVGESPGSPAAGRNP